MIRAKWDWRVFCGQVGIGKERLARTECHFSPPRLTALDLHQTQILRLSLRWLRWVLEASWVRAYSSDLQASICKANVIIFTAMLWIFSELTSSGKCLGSGSRQTRLNRTISEKLGNWKKKIHTHTHICTYIWEPLIPSSVQYRW